MWFSWLMFLACDKGSVEDSGQDTAPSQDSGDGYTGAEVIGLRILPEDPNTQDTLECSWESIEGASRAAIVWLEDEAIIEGQGGASLSPDYTSKWKEYTCAVTPEADITQTYTAEPVEIENSKPVITSVTLTPEEPTYEDPVITAEVEMEDADGDNLWEMDVVYQWYVNGMEEGINDYALGHTYWAKGDRVYVEVILEDGTETSDPVSSEVVVIQNSPPGVPDIEMVQETDGVICRVIEPAEDPDDDELYYTQQWRRFGVPVDLDLDCNSDGSSCLLTTDQVEAGASYGCSLSATDGEADGQPDYASLEVEGDILRYIWSWNEAASQVGSPLVSYPDVDGDGLPEFLAGAPQASVKSTKGGAVVMVSSDLAWGDTAVTGAEVVSAWVRGETTDAGFGQIVTLVQDMDGDSLPEWGIASPRLDGMGTTEAGGVSLFLSGDLLGGTELAESEAFGTLAGVNTYENLGSGLLGVDLDQDGGDELLVGAPGRNDMGDIVGGLYIIPNSVVAAGGELSTFSSEGVGTIVGEGGAEGAQLASAGDMDGDGIDEILVHAPESWSVYLVRGQDLISMFNNDGDMGGYGELSALASVRFDGDEGAGFGASLASCELPTGDRAVLIGAPQIEKSAGKVYAWTGTFGSALEEVSADSMEWRFDGNSGEELGSSLAELGSADSGLEGDWVALGASRNSITFTAAGAVYLTHASDWWEAGVYSSSEEDDAWSVVYGEAEYADFGAAVLAPGDVDGDGWPDVLVGQPRVDEEKLGFDVGGAVLWMQALPGL